MIQKRMKKKIKILKKFKLNLIPYAVDFRLNKHDDLLNYYQTFKISDNLFKFDLFLIGLRYPTAVLQRNPFFSVT